MKYIISSSFKKLKLQNDGKIRGRIFFFGGKTESTPYIHSQQLTDNPWSSMSPVSLLHPSAPFSPPPPPLSPPLLLPSPLLPFKPLLPSSPPNWVVFHFE